MNKVFQYKAYRPKSETIYNRIYQGDFEGDYPYNHSLMFSQYWTALGSPTQATRYRKDRYTGQTAASGLVLNGGQRLLIPASVGPISSGLGVQKIAIMSVWSKTDWAATATRQDLFNSNLTSTKGWGIILNYSAGYISALAGNGTTLYEAKVLLSTLTAGKHEIGMKFDSTNLKLYIDGVAVATTAVSGNIAYDGSVSLYAGSINNLTTPTNYFVNGSIHHIAIYGTGLLADLPTDTDFARYTENLVAQQSTSKDTVTLLYNFSDLVANTRRTADAIQSFLAIIFSNAALTTNLAGAGTCIRIQTATGGSSDQGITNSLNKPAIIGGQTYTASAWVKGTSGQTANIAVVPVGGGSTASKAITLDGTWQRIALTYTTNGAATALETRVYLSSANSSVKNLYVDAIMLEDGSTLHDYFNTSTPDNKPESYYYADVTNKRHVAKLKTFEYLTTWTDVVSDYGLQQEINTAGSQVTITLARTYEDTGTGTDVDENIRVQISVISDNYINGKSVFIGKIVNYTKTIDQEESVEVALLGYGENLDRTALEDAPTPVFNNENSAGNPMTAGYATLFFIGQSYMTEPDQTNISALSFWAKAGSYSYWNGVGDIHDPANTITVEYSNQLQLVQIWEDLTQASGGGSGFPPSGGGVPLATAYVVGPPSGINYAWWTWELTDSAGNPTPLEVNPNQRYYITITPLEYNGASGASIMVDTSDTNVRPGDYAFDNDIGPGGGLEQYTDRTMTMRVYQSYGATKVSYNSMDPSNILKRAIDDFRRQGGLLDYDDTSIDLTGTVVSYPFNTNTVWEVFEQCVKLAPANWYLYIDHGTNKVHFHSKATATVHKLTLGIDFESATFETRLESVINKIYFTGAEDEANPGQNLFRVYKNQGSIDDHEMRAVPFNDLRVEDPDTMDIMANALLEQFPDPEIRTRLNALSGGSIVLEDVKPGDMLEFEGYPEGPPAPPLQLVRYEYTPDRLGGMLSSTPPDVNKRVEDIQRNLNAQVVATNPSIATEGS